MLYVLGGASRSGKSIIAKKLLINKQIPYFSTDFLVTILENGNSSLGIKQGLNPILKSEKLWNYVKPLLINHIINEERDYLIEGDGLLPNYISEIVSEYPRMTRVCFVGYGDINPELKVQSINKYDISSDSWTKYFTEEDKLKHVIKMISFSKYLKKECKKYHLRYFDSTKNFDLFLSNVYEYLAT